MEFLTNNVPQRAFITGTYSLFVYALTISGCGSAIPGVGELSNKGMLVDIQLVVDKLIAYGIHQPQTMKPVACDFASRHLGSAFLAVGDVDDFEIGFGWKKEGSERISELAIVKVAVDKALKDAGITAAELDSIFYVSPCIRQQRGSGVDMGLHHCMREFPKLFPGLRPDCLLFHQDSGCSGVVPPFRLAKPMLESGEHKNILVVCASYGGGMRRNAKMVGKANDLSEWISYILFGDGASAFVLSGAQSPEALASKTANGACYELLMIDSFTDSSFPIMEMNVDIMKAEYAESDVIVNRLHLNPDAAKMVFTKTLLEWMKKHKIQPSALEALFVHQPNGFVISEIQKQVGSDKVLNIAGKYGNLVAASLGTQFAEQLGKTQLADKGFIAGFTLGAHAGMTYGGFVAQVHRARKE